MKRFVLILILCSSSVVLFAQNNDTVSDRVRYNIEMGTSFGRDFFMGDFFSTYIAPSATIQANNKTTIRLGFLSTTTDFTNRTSARDRDLTPYKNRFQGRAVTVGVDYQFNEKHTLSVTGYIDDFSTLNGKSLYTYAANVNWNYMINENSAFNFSFTFIESNNPMTYYSVFSPYRHYGFNTLPFNNPFFH